MYPQWNIATYLTWFRVVAIPVVAVVFYWPAPWARPVSAGLFVLAAVTDWLDGYIARRLHQVSKFGEFLDPVADKLMVSTALILLLQQDPKITIATLAVIIIGREITVSALREWMAALGNRHRVAVSGLGKLKTILQMTGLCCMLLGQPDELLMGLPVYEIGLLLLVVAAGLTIWSMFGYVRAAWPARAKRDDYS